MTVFLEDIAGDEDQDPLFDADMPCIPRLGEYLLIDRSDVFLKAIVRTVQYYLGPDDNDWIAWCRVDVLKYFKRP